MKFYAFILSGALLGVSPVILTLLFQKKPAAVHSCDAQAGKVIYAHRRKQARCMVQV